MAKVEWGVKRTCQACAAHFYDLQKTPITCPKCHAPYELIGQSRRGRGRQAALSDAKLSVIDDLALGDALDLPEDLVADGTDTLIDDADDLAESLDDIDVIDHRDDEH
jgi:hypothetical protein